MRVTYIFNITEKAKKIENFQFSMLKFTISVSNLYMKPIWATFEFFTSDKSSYGTIPTQIFRDLLNCPHWFQGQFFSQNFENDRFHRPTDFTDHIIVTPLFMFKDNSTQSFRKT